jgi:hypothetical protein
MRNSSLLWPVTLSCRTKSVTSSAYAGDHGLGRGGMRNCGWKLSGVTLSCFGGFRRWADDPPKPRYSRTESPQRPVAQVGLVLEDHGLARGAPFRVVLNRFPRDLEGQGCISRFPILQ